MKIQVAGVSKKFGGFSALEDVSLEVGSGELIALLGPSGSGKTTLLRIIAGLEHPDSGTVWYGDEDVTFKAPGERRVGFVFQHYALFKHMTVFENVAFGLRVRPRATRPPNREIERRVHELLRLVQLDWAAKRYPNQLSGGQRQRIALARALAVEPKVLLLDEPFGALDAQVREELRRWLRKLHDEIGLTSVSSPTTKKKPWKSPTGWWYSTRAASSRRGPRRRSTTLRPPPSYTTFLAGLMPSRAVSCGPMSLRYPPSRGATYAPAC